MKEEVRRLLSEKEVAGFLGLRRDERGAVVPHLFTLENIDEVESLVVEEDQRYSPGKILLKIVAAHPGEKIGVMARGCDERALIELHKRNQLNLDDIVILGVACTRALAEKCRCPLPFPSKIAHGEKVEGVTGREELEAIEKLVEDERFRSWMESFSKCLKCQGCRSVCPLCYCPECGLAEESIIRHGEVPPEFPVFHLARALCLAGRCIDCGACEEACPADIPLRKLSKRMQEIMKELFDYVPGMSPDDNNPLSFTGDAEALKRLGGVIAAMKEEG